VVSCTRDTSADRRVRMRSVRHAGFPPGSQLISNNEHTQGSCHHPAGQADQLPHTLLRSSIHPTIHLLRRMPICLGLAASQHPRNAAPHIQVTRYLQGTVTLRDTYLY
jgi:hypothetical protein